jgi:menaquinone-dependent protoporphyrinogen oxidase
MILVAYASKHGATREIVERIAQTLTTAGQEAEARPVREAQDLDGYDAVVIGSAAYHGHWLKEAVEFVRRNQAILTDRPVWLFSSGPLGTEATDAQGRDLREGRRAQGARRAGGAHPPAGSPSLLRRVGPEQAGVP